MALWFIRVSLAYVVIGVLYGIAIGVTEQFGFADVHAHLNLLGWATLALAGIIYWLFPAAGNNRLAIAHFWLQNVAMPVFIAGMLLVDAGNRAAGIPLVSAGSIVVFVAIALFAVNVWLNVRPARA